MKVVLDGVVHTQYVVDAAGLKTSAACTTALPVNMLTAEPPGDVLNAKEELVGDGDESTK